MGELTKILGMIKNKLIYLVATLMLLTGLIVFSLYNSYSTKTPDAKNFIDKIREENKAGFDSLPKAINKENNLNYRIKKSISTGDFKIAYALMDSLPSFGKTSSIHLYKGMIYAEQKKYTEAIEEYNILIDTEPFPLALDKRAETYIKMEKLDFALNDYKKAYSLNYDYSLQVATTFELINKKDSALKYYQIYLGHYPNDTLVKKKVSLLKSF